MSCAVFSPSCCVRRRRGASAFSPGYDSKRSTTVSGIVVEFRFANPHAMLTLDVKDDAGKR